MEQGREGEEAKRRLAGERKATQKGSRGRANSPEKVERRRRGKVRNVEVKEEKRQDAEPSGKPCSE